VVLDVEIHDVRLFQMILEVTNHKSYLLPKMETP